MVTDEDDQPFDPKRRLCPDGGCIGILGSDGRCNVCGKPGGDGEPASPDADAASLVDEHGSNDSASFDEDGATTLPFDANRRLCSDGSCIGVIGADNRCRVCGKPG